jgi:IclR family acetate operon transcriptional repressor
LDILLCFTPQEPRLTLTQIAEQVGMHKSTVLRLLHTLENKRFISRDKISGMYQLGWGFVEMASVMLHNLNIQRLIQPYLQCLSDESGETVDLAILDGDHVIYLEVVESPKRVKIAAAVGERLPVFCTATGKAFLAYLPSDQLKDVLSEGLARYTENTLLTLEELYEDLNLTRERGFAISEQEYERDINAVAAPILDANDYPVAVIAIVGPAFRLSRERMEKFGGLIRETTKAIAHEAGPATLPRLISQSSTSQNSRYIEQKG